MSSHTNKRTKTKAKKNRTSRLVHIPKKFRDAMNKRQRVKRPSSGSNDCPICFEKMEQKNIAILPCGHKFHFSCIYRSAANNLSCPLCRANILPTNVPRVATLPRVIIMANGTERTLHHDQHGQLGNAGALYETDGRLLDFSYRILPEVFTIVYDETVH